MLPMPRVFHYRLFVAALTGIGLVALQGNQANAQTVSYSALYTLNGQNAGDAFGTSVGNAGDVDGDGFSDFFVGSPGDDVAGIGSIGSFSVFSGASGSQLYQRTGFLVPGTTGFFSGFGNSISLASDFDSDGVRDIVATDAGTLYTISGADGSLIDSRGIATDINARVAAIGDLNGDGFSEIVVGTPGGTSGGVASGFVDVLSGDGSYASLFQVSGDQNAQNFGSSIAGAGDVNADGTPDLIVGGFGDDTNAVNSGLASVLSGADGSALLTITGDNRLAELGSSVSGIGDINADGFADLLVGAPGDDAGGDSNGSVTAVSGADGSTLYTVSGDDDEDSLFRIARLTDINGDGVDEFAATAPGDDDGGTNSGSVRLFSGIDGDVITTFYGDSSGDFLNAVSSAGDVNGDGIDDLIVGSRNGGTNNGGYARIFVSQISNVPEPSGLVLLGIVSLAGMVKRRRS